MSHPVNISATIITFNEENKIEACIQSLLGVADEILVVDSFSTDGTESICKRYNVRFLKNTFSGYIAQKNFAMNMAQHDIILSLDADERLSQQLRESILTIKNNWGDVEGYAFNRYNNYCGKWMNYGGWYPDRKIRLWDRRKGQWGGVDPHDNVVLTRSKVKKLNGDILHYSYLTVHEHLAQILRFSEIAAKAKYRRGERTNAAASVFFSPFFRFVKSYFFQFGFLDGYYGFVYCAVASTSTFFKYLRLHEYYSKGLPEGISSVAAEKESTAAKESLAFEDRL
ncbi:MAG TPA: glycosyltransferase family 2 protein [Cyclobacteriaceae bacterium]|nr:glycosyltransferase family 2 protein [Cyclobacteriaceae bacterium]